MEENEKCYSRMLPLNRLISSEEVLKDIEDITLRVNSVVGHAYKFIRLYFLYQLENDMSLPKIDRSWIKKVFALFSTSPKSGRKRENELSEFYKQYYLNIQEDNEVNSYGLKEVLTRETITIKTAVENHVKNTFHNCRNFHCPIYILFC